MYSRPQAITVLESVQAKYKTGLISNLTFSESAWDLLKINNLKNLFDFIIVSGDVNMRKPDPKIFKIALDELAYLLMKQFLSETRWKQTSRAQ